MDGLWDLGHSPSAGATTAMKMDGWIMGLGHSPGAGATSAMKTDGWMDYGI